jgi:glycosyltransferase involved in cell wall biosynthesis
MRVTHVITRLIVGGAQENTIATVLGLSSRPGIEVDLISGPTSGPEGSLEGHLGTPPRRFTVVPELVRPVAPIRDLLAIAKLTTIFRISQPDIVHTHSGKAGVIGRIAAARAGVGVIVHTIHGPSFGTWQGSLPNFVFKSAERKAARVTTHFVVVADAMTQQYLAAGIGNPSMYTKILSGFEVGPFLDLRDNSDLRRKLGLEPTDIVVGKIARLFKLKGHDDLFSIAPWLVQACPRIRFLLIGDGPWRDRFKAQAQRLGLEKHFLFAGLVPPEEVPRYVGAMDILVHLSLREGLPRALSQALAAGRPVVAYDCDGAREICLHDKTGLLVQPHDLAELKASLLRLVNDPGLRSRLGAEGQAFVKRSFSVQCMVDQIESLYHRLLAQRRAVGESRTRT